MRAHLPPKLLPLRPADPSRSDALIPPNTTIPPTIRSEPLAKNPALATISRQALKGIKVSHAISAREFFNFRADITSLTRYEGFTDEEAVAAVSSYLDAYLRVQITTAHPRSLEDVWSFFDSLPQIRNAEYEAIEALRRTSQYTEALSTADLIMRYQTILPSIPETSSSARQYELQQLFMHSLSNNLRAPVLTQAGPIMSHKGVTALPLHDFFECARRASIYTKPEHKSGKTPHSHSHLRPPAINQVTSGRETLPAAYSSGNPLTADGHTWFREHPDWCKYCRQQGHRLDACPTNKRAHASIPPAIHTFPANRTSNGHTLPLATAVLSHAVQSNPGVAPGLDPVCVPSVTAPVIDVEVPTVALVSPSLSPPYTSDSHPQLAGEGTSCVPSQIAGVAARPSLVCIDSPDAAPLIGEDQSRHTTTPELPILQTWAPAMDSFSFDIRLGISTPDIPAIMLRDTGCSGMVFFRFYRLYLDLILILSVGWL